MMEATNRNQLNLLIIVFALPICFHLSNPLFAQTSSSDQTLSQLLDSAEILKLKERYNQAINICERVNSRAREISKWEILARSLNELAEINRYIDNYQLTQKYLDQSKEIILNHLDTLNHEMARNLFYQAKLNKFERNTLKGFPDNIIPYYLRAEEILRQSGNFPNELCNVLMDIGRYYNDPLNNVKIAKQYFQELTVLVNKNFDKEDYLRGFYLYYTGDFYNSIADYERAILCMSLAKYIFSYPTTRDNNRLLQTEMYLGNIYYNTNQYKSAISHYLNVIEIAEKNQLQNYADILDVNSNLGRAYYELNNLDSSFFHSKKANSMNMRKNSDDNEIFSRTLLNLGLAHSLEGNYRKAEEYFAKAITLIIETFGEKNFKTHVFHRTIGNYYQKQNLLDKALDSYQKGLIALFPNFHSRNIYTDPGYHEYEKKEDVLYILTDKAEALYRRYMNNKNQEDLLAVFRLYTFLYDLSDDLINSGMMDESMTQVFLGFRTSFNLSIECAFDLYYETDDKKYYKQAYQFIEKSRYILLQKALMNSLYKEYAGISDEIFIQQRQLDHDINGLKYRLSVTKDDTQAFSYQISLMNKLIEKDKISSQILKENSINISSFAKNQSLTIEEIQNELVQDDEIIIEYQWSHNFIYALSIGKNQLEVVKIKITQELLKHISKYAQSISGNSSDDYINPGFQRYISSAHYLYQYLFEPVLLKFNNSSNENAKINQVTIVSDGMLSNLPFESLLTQIPDTSTTVSYFTLPYLLNDFTFRYAYSLNILRNNLSASQKIENPKLLAFSYSSSIDDNSEIAQLRSQEEIRYSAEELNSIKSLIKNGDYYEDADATEILFKNTAAAHSLIHLALHGQADITDIYNSRLIFKDGGGQDEDGKLYAYELYNMDLSNTEMVVLSACETGIGQQTEGEGIFSIARGFAYAGCPSIFMSLWKVNDKTTAELMDYFYANLIKGLPKDKAMQLAKIEFIENSEDDFKSHPVNWAAFIALGNNHPIHTPRSLFHWYYALLVIILFFIVAYFIYYKKNSTFSKQ